MIILLIEFLQLQTKDENMKRNFEIQVFEHHSNLFRVVDELETDLSSDIVAEENMVDVIFEHYNKWDKKSEFFGQIWEVFPGTEKEKDFIYEMKLPPVVKGEINAQKVHFKRKER